MPVHDTHIYLYAFSPLPAKQYNSVRRWQHIPFRHSPYIVSFIIMYMRRCNLYGHIYLIERINKVILLKDVRYTRMLLQ